MKDKKPNRYMKHVLITMPDKMKKEARNMAVEELGKPNLSGFIRFLIKEYKNANPIDKVIGRWPGDETAEELIE